MGFEDWSNNKKKKKPSSFEEWSNANRGISKAQEEEDERKRQAYLSRNKSDDDIAPVGGNKDSWFKSGGFSDGVDGVGDFFGDLGETIGGTVGDLGLGIVKGAGRMVEGLVDLGTYGVAGVADAFGADDFAEKTRKVARYSATDEWTKPATDFLDRYSVLGNKADAVSEGLGQVGALILTGGAGAAAGLSGAGVAALTTGMTGLSSMGTGMGSAYDEGATDGEAFLYGLGAGAIEAGTELLFGGLGKTVKALGISRGIGGLDDIFAKRLSSVITKSIANESVQKVLGNTAEYAVKASGEGFEEVLSGLGSAVMKKLTYAEDEELDKLIKDENLLEQFVVGAITSSIVQGGDFVKATASNTDLVTGLTTADEKVVDKVVKDEIAKREAEGKKLSIKDKNDIYDSVVEQMEKGQIDIDTIESTLGGDTYKAYTDAIKSEDALKAEYEELANIKKSDLTTKQEKRLAELEDMNLDDTTKRDGLRKNLDDTLSPMLKGSKVSESYRERERRGQAFEADLNKYTGKQREAVERAVKSGVLNNTYRSHELVDVLSKIEAAKGISFDYTNNAKLKESGFAVEGKTVNGYANKKTGSVTLNVQSSKAWQSVVGHEITHVLEGTESYGALRDALYAYANSKGDLEGRRATLTELYHGLDAETDIDSELTADLVGDYLFTDREFINHLTGNRTLFQRVYDEIKYLWNVATGKEKTEIERVKAEFDRAWKEYSAKNTADNSSEWEFVDDAGESDVEYSISVSDKKTLDSLNEQVARGEYDAETNPDGGYYVTYKSMSFWGYDDEGSAILRSPMAEYVDGELSNAYLIPKDKSKLNWYQATETIDENTGLPSGLLVKTKQEGKKSFSYLPASENQHLINEDWSNLYFNLRKKIQKNGKWVNSDVPARYNPYEHSSNSMLNDQFTAAYQRDNLVTVKMYVPISEDNGAYRAQWSKDPTGWSDWKSGIVAGKIAKQKDLQRKVYLSRYAAPVEIVPDSEVAQAYKSYIEGTDVAIPDNVVSPNLLKELRNAGVPIEESGKVQYSVSDSAAKSGVEYDKTSESYSPIQYSISSWDSSDYVADREKASKDMAKNLGVSEEQASKYIDDVNSIAKMIADDKERLSYEPSPGRSAFVNNSEYGGSIDFSTICKKRRLFTGTFEAIQNALPNTVLSADEVLEIRKMMKDKGYEVSCGLCYVEGSRTNMGTFTKQFIERYAATNPEYVPNMAEMNTATGQEVLRKEHPEVYEAYEHFMNNYGRLAPTDKALFASQQKPKMYQMATEYKGEILKKYGGKDKSAAKAKSVAEKNKNGGIRLQSFSDFEIIHLIDSMQVIMDMSRAGLAGQAYTKVPDFAWALGDTGLKINLSLIAKDVDADGRLILDEVEGMSESDAMALRDRYSDNVGTIIVVFTDAQLKAAMADERIDYIIPYHRSQWKTSQYEAMGLPENTKDYTNYQSESYIVDVFNSKGKKLRPDNYMPNSYWDFTKSGKENAEAYLAMCADNNRRPKFSHLLVDNGDGSYSLQPDGSTDGYWKTLIDFKMYNNDGVGVPQNPVVPNFNMEEAQRMLNEYTGGHAKFPVAKDIVDEFVSKHPDNIAPVQYSLSADSDAEYMSAVERGDMETAQMMVDEAAKNAGYTRKLYHGTASKFNVFGFGRTGIFTTNNFDMAKTYGDNVMSLYGKEGAKVLTVDAKESPHWSIEVSKDVLDFSEYPLMRGKERYSTNDISLIAFREGYDVVVIDNVYDNYSAASGNTENGLGTDVVYKDPNQVKSSEAVTYDDNGNVIPLSERFNEKSKDVRYSLSEEGEESAPIGNYRTPFRELALERDIAPVSTNTPTAEANTPTAEANTPTVRKDTPTEETASSPSAKIDKASFASDKASDLYEEVRSMRKGVRVSRELGYLLDHLDLSEESKSESYDKLRTALLNIKNRPDSTVNEGSRIEAVAREMISDAYDETVYGADGLVAIKLKAVEENIAKNEADRKEAYESYEQQIARKQAELESKKNQNTKLANNIKMQIERLRRLQSSTDAQYANSISKLEERAKKMRDPKFSRAMRARAKMQEHAQYAADLLGNTATWKDKKFGLQYAANTERRNLRDIVRDANGKADIARADRIDDALNGQYNRDEAARKREVAQKRKKYADLKITSAEDAYIQMLGELRYNPDTEMTGVAVAEYYEKHKSKIDTEKVDKIIEMARQDYDEWFERANAALREQGMREIPYRQGYFPHHTEPKQNFIQKLLNWKTQDNEIPTSIAGLTETFRPKKSWQSFDKARTTDKTDYSFTKGYDKYSDGVTDWIYHLDTLQKRRAVENHIRLTHSDEGIQQQIRQVYAREDLDADEAQAEIGRILAEANNPLNNFVQDFTTHTNILAGKKNSLDRTLEQWTNRDIYTVMSNVQNRVSANMVLANVRSALTNFIPITQSWAQVSPARSLQAAKDTIANAIKDDGMVDKSTFLTNRLKEADKLYQSTWDKVIDKAGIMFEIVDNFSSQVIWRSKYNQNLANGMSEDAAIKNADQFAENVMAGRSKGNEPTLFNAKNPLVKAFTAFQLEVTNQYGYLLKDVPNDLKTETNHWKLNLAKGYATAFVGAYVYNALLEKITGSEAALDPIGIIEELLRDLGMFDDDEEKEPKEALENLKDNVLEQMPFVGGYLGGGRFPISNALPIKELVSGKDSYGNEISRVETALEAAPYTLLPFGYGQIKKTAQGLNMFSDEHPVSGSYTDSGNLRFPVEDTPLNRAQAAIFGQYASKNAREYFDNGYAPLNEKQIQEYIDVDIPIGDYREYREGLKGLTKTEEKFDYISGLDLPIDKKNILANNVTDRKTPVDLTNYDDFGSLEEFDFATKQPEKYAFAKSVGGYSAYKRYSGELGDIKSDKDANGKTINGSRKEKVIEYINNLDADYYTKIILLKSEYPSDDSYNAEIIDYLNGRDDITYDEQVSILTELGFRVTADGQIYAD